MEKIIIDTGIKEYDCGGKAPLRVNFADPAFYSRFSKMQDEISKLEEKMVEEAEAKNITDGDDVISILSVTDAKVKKVLNECFGVGNDFDKILNGANLMAVGLNGERVISNVLAAITPKIEEGCKTFVNGQAEKIASNRAQRRATQKGDK